MRSRVPPLVAASRCGPAIDLDALLLALLQDVVTGARMSVQPRRAAPSAGRPCLMP